jgi:hypothetical protein
LRPRSYGEETLHRQTVRAHTLSQRDKAASGVSCDLEVVDDTVVELDTIDRDGSGVRALRSHPPADSIVISVAAAADIERCRPNPNVDTATGEQGRGGAKAVSNLRPRSCNCRRPSIPATCRHSGRGYCRWRNRIAANAGCRLGSRPQNATVAPARVAASVRVYSWASTQSFRKLARPLAWKFLRSAVSS